MFADRIITYKLHVFRFAYFYRHINLVTYNILTTKQLVMNTKKSYAKAVKAVRREKKRWSRVYFIVHQLFKNFS